MTDVHNISVTGGSFPAQIWQKFMVKADKEYPEADFTKPEVLVSYNPHFRSTYAAFPSSTTTESTTTTTLPPPPPPPPPAP
jgi:membrane carboxypeptidase/penicillin-binding protein